MSGRPNKGHARDRALVKFRNGAGGTSTGRLVCIGGKGRAKDVCRIVLGSGKFVTVRIDDVELVAEAPRSVN